MTKCKKWLQTILPILFLLLSLLPIKETFAAENDPVYDKIIQKGELVVGLSADYAPYEFHAKVDGEDKIVGFDISIAQKIADDLGVKLKIEELGFDALLGALKTGKIDMVISGMSPTPERLKEVAFSQPYMNVQQRVIVRKEDKDKFHSTKDFEGVRAGAQAYVSQNEDLAFADVTFEKGSKDTAVAFPKDAPVLTEKVNASIKQINDQKLMDGYKKEANQLMFQKDQSFLQKYGKFYLNGAGYTIFLAFIGVLFGAILGALLALMKLANSKILRGIAIAYIEYVRGTPLLVQIFIVYFGTGVLGLDLSKVAAGCIALSLNSGAYVAEIIRAGIQAVNKGQLEAARSLGMNQNQAMRYIIFPQAIKNILPALGNEFVTVIKESSVVSVIGVSELIFQAGNVQGASFKPFLPYLIVSLIYFVLTFTISRLLGVAERRMSTSD